MWHSYTKIPNLPVHRKIGAVSVAGTGVRIILRSRKKKQNGTSTVSPKCIQGHNEIPSFLKSLEINDLKKVAERVRFEPTYRLLTDNSISSRARYGQLRYLSAKVTGKIFTRIPENRQAFYCGRARFPS